MSNYQIKLLLIVTKEGEREKFYFDAFSELDVNRAISNPFYKVVDFISIPLIDYYKVIEEFESIFQECGEVDLGNSLNKKVSYDLSFQKYFEVIEWIRLKKNKYNFNKII